MAPARLYREPSWEPTGEEATDTGEPVGARHSAKAARFTPKSVEQALSDLRERIQAVNADEAESHRVTRAVEFGDFLSDRVRVQAVTVGIELERRAQAKVDDRSTAAARGEEDAFLKQLNGKSTILRLQRYEPWMSHRSHRDLL